MGAMQPTDRAREWRIDQFVGLGELLVGDRDGLLGLEFRDLCYLFVLGLVPLFPPSLKQRIECPKHSQSKESYDAGEAEPIHPVIVDGKKEVLFRQRS